MDTNATHSKQNNNTQIPSRKLGKIRKCIGKLERDLRSLQILLQKFVDEEKRLFTFGSMSQVILKVSPMLPNLMWLLMHYVQLGSQLTATQRDEIFGSLGEELENSDSWSKLVEDLEETMDKLASSDPGMNFLKDTLNAQDPAKDATSVK